MLFDDHFDARFLVAGNYDEAGEVRRDSVVLSRNKLDLVDAVVICALTMKRERLLDSVFLRTLIDALIDRAKHLFVVRRAVREVHRSIFARSLSAVTSIAVPAPSSLRADLCRAVELTARRVLVAKARARLLSPPSAQLDLQCVKPRLARRTRTVTCTPLGPHRHRARSSGKLG